MLPLGTETKPGAEPSPIFGEVLRVWAQIGVLSFGGPTAQISLMHRVIVEERKWLGEQQFLNALSFCMLLPGPEAMQLATYAGWRLHGVKGGITAGLLFVLPGAAVVLALSMTYATFGSVPFVEAMFLGVKAAVLVIVIEALMRIARRALKGPQYWLLAALSFIAIFFLTLPFPLILLLAALYGFTWSSTKVPNERERTNRVEVSAGKTMRTVAIWLAIWLGPLVALNLALGSDTILSKLGWFFSKLAVVTFGGAYAVLAYMGQDVVVRFGWLGAGQMIDGLGLAETTPGPLILVTEFVGYLAAYRQGGDSAWAMGLAGALIALWATFTPCFLWIFAGAPYIEWISDQPRLKGALTAVTAAVVGVILNLALWFALHVFFGEVVSRTFGFLRIWTPNIETLDWRVVVLAAVSAFLLLQRHWKIPSVLAIASLLSLVFRFAEY